MILTAVQFASCLAFNETPCEGSLYIRARKIFEFHLAHWASNPQILLARVSSPLAQVFELINNSRTQEWRSKYRAACFKFHVINLS